MKKYLLYVLLFFFIKKSSAQQATEEPDKIVERLFSQQEVDIAYESFYENIIMYLSSPLNINKANVEQLQSLYILNNQQIFNLKEHIKKNGRLMSLLELQAIDGFDDHTVSMLRLLTTVRNVSNDPRTFGERLKKPDDHYLFSRFSVRYPSSGKYIGGQGQLFMRYRIRNMNDFSLGITAEKDDGERYWSNGPDYYSFHAQKNFNGAVRNIIIGDFQYQVGQGLIYGGGFSLGKGTETILTTVKPSIGAMTYTSSMENGFFRGISATADIAGGALSLFLSRNKIDARLSDDEVTGERIIRSFPGSGYHRTQSELKNKNSTTESSAGGFYQTTIFRHLMIGSSFLYQKWNYPVLPSSNIYNSFDFRGTENHNISGYFKANFSNMLAFGEFATSKSGGKAIVSGITSILNDQLEMSVLYRNYQSMYHSFYSNGFSEGTDNANEQGLYLGLKIKPGKKQIISLYYDLFYFPWIQFRTYKPSFGYEALVFYEKEFNKGLTLSTQMRYENKEINNDNWLESILKQRHTFKTIGDLDFILSSDFSGQTRIQFSSTQMQKSTNGWALMQDISYTKTKFRFSARYAIFDTDFDNRQYAYEKDVLYAFSIPAYQGMGSRIYSLVQWKVTKSISLWSKIASTSILDKSVVGNIQKRTWTLRLQAQMKLN